MLNVTTEMMAVSDEEMQSSSPEAVLLPDNAGSEGKDPVPKTIAGVPVSLLWVPYVILTFVILLLMGISFLRFHRKNGHKYRQRMQFLRQINMQQLLNQIQNQVGGPMPPNGGSIPEQPSTSQGTCTNQNQTQNQTQPTANATARRHHKPIAFQQFDNGSMVDLRVGDAGYASMFKTPFSISSDSSLWSTIHIAKAGYKPQKNVMHFSDEEEDDTLLIQCHATKL